MELSAEARHKAAAVRLVVFDVDGVLTDGRIELADDNTESKSFHAHDGLGMQLLMQAGIQVAIITSRSTPVVEHRMRELGIKHVMQKAGDKREALLKLLQKLDIPAEAAAFVGDDLIDLPAMRLAGLAIAVANANHYVLEHADCITTIKGGRGGVREVCDMLLEVQDKMADCLSRYLD